MRRLFIYNFVIPLFLVVFSVTVSAAPGYAKWGTIAVKETQKRYNDSEIIDYKHIGRIKLTPNNSEDKFKLRLRNRDGKEFSVYVHVVFETKTNVFKTIRFFETHR